MPRPSLAACLVPLLVSLPAAAQDLPSDAPAMESGACLSGWALFQALVGATPPEGEPLAAPILEDGHCRVDNPVVASPQMTYHARRIAWAAAGFEALMQGALPDRVDLAIEGLVMQPRLDQPLWDYVTLAQARASGGIDLRATARQADGGLTLSETEIGFPDGSRIRLEAELTDLAPLAPMDTLLRHARLEIRTQGLFERYLLAPLVLAYFDPALPAEMQAEMRRAEATQVVSDLPDSNFPTETRRAMAAFIADFPNPRGDLTLQLEAPQGMRLAQFTYLPEAVGASELASALAGVQIGVDYVPLPEGDPD